MISILIADDQNIVRKGIKVFLEPCEGIEVIGMAQNGEETIKQVEALKPDILLLDVEMPLGNGIHICHQISQKFPETKTILLSSHEEKIYIQQGIKAGAKGYLLKSAASEELERAIKLVHMGFSVFESKILQKLIRKNPPPSASEYAQINIGQREEIGRRNSIKTANDLAVEKLEPVLIKSNVNQQSENKGESSWCASPGVRSFQTSEFTSGDSPSLYGGGHKLPLRAQESHPYGRGGVISESDLDIDSYNENDWSDNRYLQNLNRCRQQRASKTINGIHIHIWNLCLATILIIIVMAVIFLFSS